MINHHTPHFLKGNLKERLTGALAACLLFALAASGVLAQSAEGDPTDITFEIVNATTGEPGKVSRLTIEYMNVRPNKIADQQPSGPSFTAQSIPLINGGTYIVTVWADGVPYWWSKKGRDLKNSPVTLHVFDTTSNSDGLALSGLDVVIKGDGSVLNVEYMIQITNEISPQVTVNGSGSVFALALPMGATEIEAVYMRGPAPMPVDIDQRGSMVGLSLPVTPGNLQVRLTAMVPFEDGMGYEIGGNIPIRAWALLTAPATLQVDAMGLEENTHEAIPGYRRFSGDALDAGDTFDMRLSMVSGGGPEVDIFTGEAPVEATAADDQTEEESKPNYLPLILLGGLMIVILAGAARRRKK